MQSIMDSEIEERFPWLPMIQRGFLESFSGDYGARLLEQLQWNIAKEIQMVELKFDFKIAKLLLKSVEYFYLHFCRIWSYQNKVYPYKFVFSSHMKSAWVHILSSFIKICLLLSRGKKSKWLSRALNAIAKFPGEKSLIYDALLFVHRLKKKYKPAYGFILKSLLMDMPLFFPVIIDDPVVFLKMHLLVRRLKLRIKDHAEKAALQVKVSKIPAPASLWDWLLDHEFFVPWTKKGVRKVNLGVNICRKLGRNDSQTEIVETLRKILLPGLCMEKKTEQRRPPVKNPSIKRNYVSVTSCADQVSSEDDNEIVSSEAENKIKTRITCVNVIFKAQVPYEDEKIAAGERKNKGETRRTRVSVSCADQAVSEDGNEEIVIKETKVKSKGLKRVKEKHQEDGKEGISVSSPEMKRPVGALKDPVNFEEDISHTIDHSLVINTFKHGEVISEKKNKKKQKSVYLEENMQHEIEPPGLLFQECGSKPVELSTDEGKEQELGTTAGKIRNKASRSAGRRKLSEMESKNKQKSCIGSSDSENEHKSKKSQRKDILAKKNKDDGNITSCDHSLLEDISQTAKITKNRRKQQKRQKAIDKKKLESKYKETDIIAINNDSDAEDLPVIVDEIYVNKSVPDKRVYLPKIIVNSGSNCSDDNQPVILDEVKHRLNSDINSFHRKKKKNAESELESNLNAENKIVDENIFTIDSKPSSYLGEFNANQITYSTMYSAYQKDTTCEKFENISNSVEELNPTGTFMDLKDNDLLAEYNSSLKITDYSHTFEDTQGSCASSPISFSSDQQEPISKKKISAFPDDQTNVNMSGQDCNHEDRNNDVSSTMGEYSGNITQTDKEFSLDSAVQTERFGYSPNQTSDLGKNCIKSDSTSKKLLDEKENVPSWTDFEKETTLKTNISQGVLESHESSVSDHSSLLGNSSAQVVEVQKVEHPSFEDEFISVINKVDSLETDHMDTETTGNNARVIVEGESPFENSAWSCDVNEEKIIQKNRVSQSFTGSPLNKTFYLKTTKISSPSVAETVSSDSVESSSPEKKNIEKIENICSIKIKNEEKKKLENSVSNLLENKVSLQIIPINNDNFQKIVIKEEKSTSDKIKSEMVSDSDSNSSFDVDTLEIKKERDNTNIDMHIPSQNNSIDDQPNYQVTGLFFDIKSLISKVEGDLLEDSKRSSRILNLTMQNLDTKAKVSVNDTPNTSAAKVTIENVLKLAEFADFGREPIRRYINKRDLTSTLNSPSVMHLSKFSSNANEKSTGCLSFLDISAENIGSLNESQGFTSHTPEITDFLQYRDLSDVQDDNRSEGTFSESKSTLKTDSSECPSDVSNDTESEGSKSSPIDCNSPGSSSDVSKFKNNYDTYVVKTECSWDDTITRQRFCQDDECDTSSLDISTKIIQQKGCKLNPVVNLGERCDNINFVMNSIVPADSLNMSTNSSVLPYNKSEDVEINETMPFKPNQASLKVDQLLSLVNETAIKPEAIEQSTSDAENRDEIGIVISDTKKDIQPGHKVEKELCLIADQEMSVFVEDQKSVELKCEKNLSGNNKATRCNKDPKLTICDKDKMSIELPREKEILQDYKITGCYKGKELTETRMGKEACLGMKLREKPAKTVQTEKSISSDEHSRIFNQDSLQTYSINLRSRSPTSSSQGQSAFVDDHSSVLNQEIPLTHCLNLRSRNPSRSSGQEKSVLASECSNVLNMDTAATSCMNLRSSNSSASFVQEVLKCRSQTSMKRSTKRLKRDVNLDFDFSELSLNSPRSLRSKQNGSSIKNSSEVDDDESKTNDQGNSSKRLTRSSVISSTVETRVKEQSTDPKGYNLRSRKSVIMPGKLKF